MQMDQALLSVMRDRFDLNIDTFLEKNTTSTGEQG